MKILRFESDESLSKIVLEKAKYQKVMLVYGDSITQTKINNIFEQIKSVCIFNKSSIEEINETELNNGYRLIIWFCSADEFLKVKINRDDFINIYCPQDNYVLPFFVNNKSFVESTEDYLLVKDYTFDEGANLSLYFNNFYKYLVDILSINENSFNVLICQKDFTTRSVLDEFESTLSGCKLLDVEILRKQKIACKYLPFVDLALIDAFLVFITAIKNKSLSMVDVYKAVKDEESLIEKFYAISNNNTIMNLIALNFNCIYNACIKTKEKILECFNLQVELTNEILSDILNKIKTYCKHSTDLECCLYIFNLFSL